MKKWLALLIVFVGFACATSKEKSQWISSEMYPISVTSVLLSINNRSTISLELMIGDPVFSSPDFYSLPPNEVTEILLQEGWFFRSKVDTKPCIIQIALPEEMGPTPLLYNHRINILREKSYTLSFVAREDASVPFGITVLERGIRSEK